MKQLRFAFVALIVSLNLLTPASVMAQSGATGSVTGHVSNAATQKYLAGAEVIDSATRRSVYTDGEGAYSLVLPEGDRVLIVNYGGLDSQTTTVTVVAGEIATKDFALTSADYDADIIKLEKFVVSGEREGRMAAVAQQKASDHIVSVIATDEFSGVTSGNIGDFLRNVSGISIGYSGDDPRDISMRGMDSAATAVTLNGLSMANAASGGTTRAFQTDQVSLQDIEFIEVFKTPTAALPADAGGGMVNMKSKSAFMLKHRRINFQASANINTNENDYPRAATSYGDVYSIRPAVNFGYSNSFLRNRLGVSFSANMNDVYRRNYNVSNDYRAAFQTSQAMGNDHPVGNDVNNGIYSNGMSYSTGNSYIRRMSASLNIDYRLTRNWTITARSQVNSSLIKEGTQGLNVRAAGYAGMDGAHVGGPASGLEAGWNPYKTVSITGGNDIRANTIEDAAASKSTSHAYTGVEALHKKGNTTTFSLSTEYKQPGGWTITADAGVSQSTNRYGTPSDMLVNSFTAYLRGIDFQLDNTPGGNYPTLTQLNGLDIYDLSNYVSKISERVDTHGSYAVGGTDRIIPDGNGDMVVIPGVSIPGKTYPKVRMPNTQKYPIQVSNGRWDNGKDKFTTLKTDAKRPFFAFGKIPMYAQLGGLFREQKRTTASNGKSRWYFNGTTDEAVDLLTAIKSKDLTEHVGDYPLVPYVSLPALNDYFKAHPEKFTEDVVWRTEQEVGRDKYVRERVYAGYAMLNMKFGRFTALLGARYEGANNYGHAPISDNDATATRAMEMMMDYVRGYGYADITSAYNDTGVNPITGITGRDMVNNYEVTQAQALELACTRYTMATVDKSYDDIYPNIQLKYDLTPNITLRASYNKSITRQKFDHLLPGYTLTVNSSNEYEITMNNPDLKPIYYDNYDFGVEFYTKGGGMLSLGYFYKDVTNYTAKRTDVLSADVDYGYDFSAYIDGSSNITHYENIGGAKQWGIEVQLTQRLSILSRSLKDFTFRGSYTYLDGKATSAFGSETSAADRNLLPTWMPVGKLVPKMFMLSLSYNKYPLNITVKYNWRSRYYNGTIRQRGSQHTLTYNDPLGRLDVDLSYKLTRKFELFLNAQNVTGNPEKTYYYDKNYMQSYRLYGATIYFGIKGNL
ncbi:TonB-dependent receptor [Ereboglobus luteus]|uniref:TonB-dependent receptor plug domain-containing protein n=1 Tax=Ereboglobus luteus TaxID=1796921 RepID=A0A2U8E1J9_9BACT|nr:TonB-dependent receptor [Ereboglobus luteus]AWI08749.1 hypothetical protein CKA38_05315 [Ereboglobus luteus]